MKTYKEIEDHKAFIEEKIKKYDDMWRDASAAGDNHKASFALRARRQMEGYQSVLAWVLE